jgi:CHAD domain-containing protein
VSAKGDKLAGLPTPEAVRAYARRLIKRTDRACRRMRDGEDGEALHDFRVGLRRLRTHLGAYRRFHALGRPDEARLKALAGGTGGARDAEVAAAWLAGRRTELKPDEVAGADWLAERLRAEREGVAEGDGLGPRMARWERLSRKLARHLLRDPKGAGPTIFAHAAADRLGRHAARLRARLGAVHTVADQAQAHRARIAAKRLRYLLEPLDGAAEEVGEATRALADLQDTLGAMHDMEALIARLGEALREVASERAGRRLAEAVERAPDAPGPEAPPPDPEPGLLRLAALAAEDRSERFRTVQAAVLADGGEGLLAGVERIRAALAARGSG